MKYLTFKELKTRFPSSTIRKYHAGQIVIYEGDQPAHTFFVIKGALRNYDIDENSSEKILHIVGESSFFPMLYIIGDDDEVKTFYSTLDDTELLLIPIKDFVAEIENDITFANEVMRWFVGEVDFIMDRIRGMEKNEGRAKVAQALCYLLGRHAKVSKKDWYQVQFPITQQILADLVGLTRETVSGILRDFEKLKVVRSSKLFNLEIHRDNLSKVITND